MKQFVTMEQFDDLEEYIVKNLATKEDLERFATKEDLNIKFDKLEQITSKILKKIL